MCKTRSGCQGQAGSHWCITASISLLLSCHLQPLPDPLLPPRALRSLWLFPPAGKHASIQLRHLLLEKHQQVTWWNAHKHLTPFRIKTAKGSWDSSQNTLDNPHDSDGNIPVSFPVLHLLKQDKWQRKQTNTLKTFLPHGSSFHETNLPWLWAGK